MVENNITIEQVKEEIKKLKLEILEKEKRIDELLEIIGSDEEDVFEEENEVE